MWGLVKLDFVGFCKAYGFKNFKKYVICLYVYMIFIGV